MNMKKMHSITAVLLVLVLLLQAVPVSGEQERDPETLYVGNTTQMKGDFFTEMFGNNTADIDVRALLHGYNLIRWDENQGLYFFDETVVSEVNVTREETGDKTYVFGLREDLRYSDGTPITAWDYAFSLLLLMSREMEEIGGKIYRAEHILGYNEYLSGESNCLSGVGVLDDYHLSVTLDHAFLPYFFELGLLMCVPYPIYVIAPGVEVRADGVVDVGDGYGIGAYLCNKDEDNPESVFCAELLRRTVLDPENGYNSHPSVVSGPYTLASFDGVTANFERNPFFKGVLRKEYREAFEPNGYWVVSGSTVWSWMGEGVPDVVVPDIEKITFTLADNDTMVSDLLEGRLDLVNKAMYAPAIDEGLAAVEKGSLQEQHYPRVGLSFVTFSYELPTVHDQEVRQAIAYCMDRDAITRRYCGDYGIRVDGYYGMEQWEYLMVTHKMDYPINFDDENNVLRQESYKEVDMHSYGVDADFSALNLDGLNHYGVDLFSARDLLESAGWTLNREGGAYTEGKDDVRCKLVDGEIVALDLALMYPEGNHIGEMLDETFIRNLNLVGIRLTLVPTPMPELLKEYYRQTPRTVDMIYLATNFHVIFDPSITYSTDTTANHQIWNNTYSDDEELYRLAVDMRQTEPSDVLGYLTKWVAFQERYNQVLPALPVYSNVYYDFFTSALTDYESSGHTTWSQAVLESHFTPAAQP